MISRICGKIEDEKGNAIFINVNGISYEILIPEIILNSILDKYNLNERISLTTFHYFQTMPSRSIPILVGFTNEIEKEFFIKFTSVSGVGPKTAVKALNKPISRIADAIDNADVGLLSELPGIGRRKAREIVAKLQGKVGKYGLIQDRDLESKINGVSEDIKQEAMEILLQLRYKKDKAKEMLEKALKQNPKLSTTEEILNQIYKHKDI